MNTQTHVLMGAALLGSTPQPDLTLAAAAGGLAPDLPMFMLVGCARWIGRHAPRDIFGTLYFSDRWQTLLAPWHSLPLWTAALALALWQGWIVAAAFAASALLHVGVDFFLHVHDAHRQLWPLSSWRFRSPVSYWDSRHHGHLFRPIEMALAIGFAGYLLTQYRSPLVVALLVATLGLYGAQLAYFWRLRRARG
jgi:F0F1-type ATP synthase assembly protein I